MKRIAILEYIGCQEYPELHDYPKQSSGAIDDLSKEVAKSDLLNEGDSMLRAVVHDLNCEGISKIHCCRHVSNGPIVSDLDVTENLSSDSNVSWHWIQSGERFLEAWLRVAQVCDEAMVIAPEIDHELLLATRFLRSHGIRLRNADDRFIATASDKALTARHWRKSSVSQPWTVLLRNHWFVSSRRQQLLDISSQAWVLKPRDGAGGVGIRRFECIDHLQLWNEHRITSPNEMLVQPWLEGVAASIAIVFHDDQTATEMPARNQVLTATVIDSTVGGKDVQFHQIAYGGSGPPWPPGAQRVAATFARKAIAAIPGVPLGWIGLDFLCEGSPLEIESYVAIEINPRLTSSYCERIEISLPH